MKLAQLEMKYALATILARFDVAKTQNTPAPKQIQYVEYMIRRPRNPIQLVLKRRANPAQQ